MPEPTPDIQDIAQLVEEADALLSEIEAVSSTIAQATSDEGPIVEPREWEPPAKPKASGRSASESAEGASAEGAAETVTAGGEGDDAAASASASEAEGESSEEVEAASAVVEAAAGEGSGVEPSAATDVRAETVDAGAGADDAGVGAEGDAGGDDADDTSAIDAISAANATSAADDAGDASDTGGTGDASEPGELNAGDAVRIVDPPAEQPVVPETLEEVHEPLCEVELSADVTNVTDEVEQVAGDAEDDAEEDAAAGALMDERAAPVAGAEPMPEPLSDAPIVVVDEDDEASERVRSLDDELARLADEMIEGEDEDGGVLIDPMGDASSEAALAGDEAGGASGEASGDANDGAEPAAEAATAGEGSKGERSKGKRTKGGPSKRESGEAGGGAGIGAGVAHGSGVGTPPVELKDRVLYHAKAAASSGIEIAREKGPLVAAQLAPAARQTCEKVSKPLEKQSPIVRHAVGVVAVTTALYASAVLFYVAFIRTPPTHQPDKPGTTLIDQTGQSIARHPDD